MAIGEVEAGGIQKNGRVKVVVFVSEDFQVGILIGALLYLIRGLVLRTHRVTGVGNGRIRVDGKVVKKVFTVVQGNLRRSVEVFKRINPTGIIIVLKVDSKKTKGIVYIKVVLIIIRLQGIRLL